MMLQKPSIAFIISGEKLSLFFFFHWKGTAEDANIFHLPTIQILQVSGEVPEVREEKKKPYKCARTLHTVLIRHLSWLLP